MPRKSNKGWIKLYRQIEDSVIWSSEEPFDRRSAWIDLLLMANHEDRTVLINGKKRVIGVGQRWISVRALAAKWGWSKDRVMRFLELLEADTMISLSKTPNGTLLTIEKYSFFQLGRDTNKDTDKDTPKDTDKDADKDETRINKNYIKNEKEITGAAGSAFSSERE
jgi:DNA replication protein DnaD